MNGSAHFVAAESHDDALDLAPVAEASDVARIAALFRPHCGFEPGIVAIALDEIGGIGKRRPSGDEGLVHVRLCSRRAVAGLPTSIVNAALTML